MLQPEARDMPPFLVRFAYKALYNTETLHTFLMFSASYAIPFYAVLYMQSPPLFTSCLLSPRVTYAVCPCAPSPAIPCLAFRVAPPPAIPLAGVT